MPWKSKPRDLKKSFSSDLEGGKESARWSPGGNPVHQGVQQGRGSVTSPHVTGTVCTPSGVQVSSLVWEPLQDIEEFPC